MQVSPEVLKYYRNKSILVTGAGGTIGGTLVANALSTVPCRIIALDKDREALHSVMPKECAATIERIKGDITEARIWDSFVNKVDCIFHFAAQTSSKRANENPTLDISVNVLPIIELLEACQRNNAFPDIVAAGTVTEVGFTKEYPVNESWPDAPITVYDINKLAAEKYLQYYAANMAGRAVTLRLANVYGPGPRVSSTDRGVLNQMVQKAMRGEKLYVYGDGDYMRDYVYIDDIVRAFLYAGSCIEKLNGKYFVIGSGVGHTIHQMATLVRDTVGNRTDLLVAIKNVEPPADLSAIEFRHFVADVSCFCEATGWRPEVALAEGIRRTVDFYQQKENGAISQS